MINKQKIDRRFQLFQNEKKKKNQIKLNVRIKIMKVVLANKISQFYLCNHVVRVQFFTAYNHSHNIFSQKLFDLRNIEIYYDFI